ncbi:MAG TPA: preprotein translocase subunit SecY [Vicinamibacteria bacterium]|uniref:Protein translocase subunit SecY n=2 Tax=environmental samples TaxID=57727 RepID=A0A0H4T6K2_9BACT|nr:protein translocase subunit secY/sec61 alpha, preprotein translocase subunit SecY [uncultured Acidobacteria bacterium Rifle_16ft_4_minimus_33611]AKQ03782.1 protein translocase subunit secY/sec61 alpha, preprotein translocase subunit SecY [uncultured Acidobacteria bacterium Rifle_16ft_4_minimus_38548]HLE21637.1 preprotein translocase subunit SecY [Vicinamibacteria bacterium]
MIESLKNIFRIPDLRSRVLFTLAMLAVYRLGNHVPTPGVDARALTQFFEENRATWFGFVDMFSGGNLSKVTVFALGIMPYISASIILQLLTVVWPYLEKLSKEGELGRRKITQYTRYGTVLLSVVQSAGIAAFLQKTSLTGGITLVNNPGFGFTLMTVLTLTAGTVFIMWLGEQITERGVGNGMSLLIFAGIVVGFPSAIVTTFRNLQTGQQSILVVLLLTAFMVLVVGAIVFVERGQRRIPVQYAKRVVGRRMYQGQSTHLPLRVNTGGVIPVIFASSIIALPQTFASLFPASQWATNIAQQLAWGMPLYTLLYVAAIIFFCYFYTGIIFNPNDVADNMRKYGGYVPGIRPGKRTAEYIDSILARLTLGGALYLAAVAVLPEFLLAGFKVAPIPVIGPFLDSLLPTFITEGLNVTFYFGGTSLLIVVGVAMDTVQQIESQLIMRHYDGFMKRGRIRGRRG